MLLSYPLDCTVNGLPRAGLTPSWYSWGSADTGTPLSSRPVIRDCKLGAYAILWDAEIAEGAGYLDWGQDVDGGRYRFVTATRESGRLLSLSLNSPGGIVITVG